MFNFFTHSRYVFVELPYVKIRNLEAYKLDNINIFTNLAFWFRKADFKKALDCWDVLKQI